MVIIETGIIWHLVAKRFEERVNAVIKDGKDWQVYVQYEHRWLGLRLLLIATLVKQMPMPRTELPK